MQFLTQVVQGLAAFQPFSTSWSASHIAATILLDDHAYSELDRVFTTNATADFNATDVPVCHGLPAIITRLEDLKDAPSMMAISTQYVDLHTPPVTAQAISYVTGNMFTPGWKEPSFTEYGKYITNMVLTDAGWRVDTLVAKGWAVFDRWEDASKSTKS